MREVLEFIYHGGRLAREQAYDLIVRMTQGDFADAQVAAFLSALRMRPLALEELIGLRDGLFSLTDKVDLSPFQPIDVCGTGGDAKNSYNISTAVAFVVAGAGIAVAKHGNHGVSSLCGSSTVLEELGIKFTANAEILKQQLERAQICFLHAPLFHPALKNFASLRKDLAVRTFFNLLGPLLNPASVTRQLVGVYNLEVARLFNYYFQSHSIDARIVYSLDGYDEVSLSAPSFVFEKNGELTLDAHHFGFKPLEEGSLNVVSSKAESAKALYDLLNNKGDQAYEKVVLANSAVAIQLVRPELSLIDTIAAANESLRSGRALRALELLQGKWG